MEIPHRRKNQGNVYQVRIDVTLPQQGELAVSHYPGGNIKAHEDVFLAVNNAFRAIERQIQKRKSCTNGKTKSRDPSQPLGQIIRLFQEDGYGFIEAPDGLEIYFHKN